MPTEPSEIRRSVFLLIAAAAVAIAAAKTVGAENVFEPSRYKASEPGGYGYEPKRKWPETRPEPTPTFSSNDKSRWATVRALVDNGTYAIGKRTYPDPNNPAKYVDEGIVADPAYKSLDIVMNPQTKEFYSSKPPLMATLVAGEYWVLKRLFGWDISSRPVAGHPDDRADVERAPVRDLSAAARPAARRAGEERFRQAPRVRDRGAGYVPSHFFRDAEQSPPRGVLRTVRELSTAAGCHREPRHARLGICTVRLLRVVRGDLRIPALSFLAALCIPLLIARTRRTLLYFFFPRH